MTSGLEYPWWLRITHWFNFFFIILLFRSGYEILMSHPKLYWSDDAKPSDVWLRVGDEERTTDFDKEAIDGEDLWAAEDEIDPPSSLISLPGRDAIGMGRHWHFWGAIGWIVCGVLYVGALLISGEWTRFVPTSLEIFPQAWDALVAYAQLQIPHTEGYNALQQLTYFGVIFVLSPLMILTGIFQAPVFRAKFPDWFGTNRQFNRSLHFIGFVAFNIFLFVHVALVAAHGFWAEMGKIVLGSEAASTELTIALTLLGVAIVIGFAGFATWISLKRPYRTQNALEIGVDPLLKGLFHHVSFVEGDDRPEASEFARVNGKPPRNDEYRTHFENDFEDWTITVDGLVENELELTPEEIREMDKQEHITRHDCIQGWTYYAKWGGVPLSAIMDRCEPHEDAEWLVFWTLDEKWEYSEDGPFEEVDDNVPEFYYEAIRMDKAREPRSILAYEMNDDNLPIAHGAPYRLRIESQLGYKMAKWVTRIEFVEDFEDIGKGYGGWRDDVLHYYPNSADI
ncbi:molybdopterin-dependent oxidoreductase [Natronococcus sp. JC468]|uniref:molybdopterin-dependent oxidoreductase n=1 Tax=Natronococcus sp. JC468 TaxID=1961921 RepID=UPI00143A57BF|nr:molybdopterin-dependent oxidoreductase [Natronococcus sp. JC468]NKE37530.1 molybdopterin-dependent oxidoreductase [Natronococcus sp. JC468]